ncbi:MAG: ComEC/Rec2 family competence protein [Actinomycetota bacterium]
MPDVAVAMLAALVSVAAWSGLAEASLIAVVVGGVSMVGAWVLRVFDRRRVLVVAAVAVVLVVVAGWRGDVERAGLVPERSGAFEGWVQVIDDPQPLRSSTRVIVEVDGQRFESFVRGRAAQIRVGEWRAGQWVSMSGTRRTLDVDRVSRVGWQHVVGEFDIEWASDVYDGSAVARASNRVRAAIERAAADLPDDDGALFRGLVIGDDRDQPWEMIDRFRASGLSHLTAVSGQNVSFVLAAAGPLLTRLRAGPRWALTLGLIAWFVAITRFEPSIVRAGVMAGLSATAFAIGRERAPVRILALAVIGLLILDPLLVWSVGFWLSVGATFGVSALGPPLAARLAIVDPTGVLALPIGVTLGAQIGVALPSLLVFGRLPLVSIPANLLAVPVAGAVMLLGLPLGLLAGWCPPLAPVLMAPFRFGTRWVDTVARIGERLEPDPPAQVIGWIVVAIIVSGVVVIADRRSPGDRGDPVAPGQTGESHGDPSAHR